jgi:hypothetical protein
MDIIEKNIDIDKLQDATKDKIPLQIGYNLLPFLYLDISKQYENTVIPKNIHFIWIGNVIKYKYIETVKTCKNINKDYSVILWVDNNSIDKDIEKHLTDNNILVKNIYYELDSKNEELQKHILRLLDLNTNYGYKADIIRLYIIYIYGGIYSDIDSVWIKPLDNNFDYEFVTYRIDTQCSNLTNSFFGFDKKSIILKNIIDNLNLSIDCFLKIKNDYIFKTFIPLITGPEFFTMNIRNLKPNDLNYIHQGYCVIGGPDEDIYNYFSKENKSYCYQTFDKNWC